MKDSNKLKIDRIIGGPLAYLLNLATRCIAAIMRRDHRFPIAPRVICVAKFAGLGSIIAAVPMLKALKHQTRKRPPILA